MLSQQVGFVCAVLALVCCASRFFGSWGRYRRGPAPGVGGLGLGSSREARRHLPFLPSQAGPLPTCQVERTQEG